MVTQSLGINTLLQLARKQSHTYLNAAMWSVSSRRALVLLSSNRMRRRISSYLWNPMVALYIGFWSGSRNSSRRATSQLLSPPERRIKPIKAMNSTLSTHLHSFSFAAAAALRPSKLVHFRTSSMMLSLINKSQASFSKTVVEPDAGPGQLLRMLWLLALP